MSADAHQKPKYGVQCPECGHPAYGSSEQEAFEKLAPHVQTEHPERFAKATGNVIPLKRRG